MAKDILYLIAELTITAITISLLFSSPQVLIAPSNYSYGNNYRLRGF